MHVLLVSMYLGADSLLLRCHVGSCFDLNTPGVLQLRGCNAVVMHNLCRQEKTPFCSCK